MEWGSQSMPVMTVAPVVVRPERDSKMASVMLISGVAERAKGRAPEKPRPTQNSTTTIKPSRRRSSRF